MDSIFYEDFKVNFYEDLMSFSKDSLKTNFLAELSRFLVTFYLICLSLY